MEKITIHKNKPEVFKCNFTIEGASTDDVSIRLCLEFNNNVNLFFFGELDSNGECTVEIPKLSDFNKETSGKLVIEAIADSTYFKVYETKIELKNSVELSMKDPIVLGAEKSTKIKLEAIDNSTVVSKEEKSNPFIPKKKEDKLTELKASFEHYLKKKK